jgi:hypothetical protein
MLCRRSLVSWNWRRLVAAPKDMPANASREKVSRQSQSPEGWSGGNRHPATKLAIAHSPIVAGRLEKTSKISATRRVVSLRFQHAPRVLTPVERWP